MAEQKKVLIVGGNSFVGTRLAKALAEHHLVTCTYRNQVTPLPGVSYIQFSYLTEKEHCKTLMQKVEPDIVIYSIGSNDIAAAELDGHATHYLHSVSATHLQSASEMVKAKFIYLSADMIFSGHNGNHSEDEPTLPASILGKSKLGAENHVRSRSLNHVIIRSAPLLGRGTLDHPSWVDLLRENELIGKKIKLSPYQIRNPVHISLLSELILKIIENDLRNQTLHLGGLTKISDFELGNRILLSLGLSTKTIEPLDLQSLGIFNSEALDYSLNFTKLIKLYKMEALTIEESLSRLLQ